MNNLFWSITFTIVVGLLGPIVLKAQDSTSTSFKTYITEKRAWELGYSFSGLIGVGQPSNVGFKHYTFKNGRAQAIRIKASLSGQNVFKQKFKESLAALSQDNTSAYMDLRVQMGREWNRPINRFVLCYGVDAFYLIHRDVGNGVNQATPPVTIDRQITNSNYGISPFIGFKYSLNSFITASIESGLDVSLQNSVFIEKTYQQLFLTNTVDRRSQAIIFNYFPINSLSLNFHF